MTWLQGNLGWVDLPVELDRFWGPITLAVMEMPAYVCLVFPQSTCHWGIQSPPWMMSTRVRLSAQCGL